MISLRAGGTDWLAFVAFDAATLAGYATRSDFVRKRLPSFQLNHVVFDFILTPRWSRCCLVAVGRRRLYALVRNRISLTVQLKTGCPFWPVITITELNRLAAADLRV